MIDSYVLIFMAGLSGGFGHCIGMCGPVVVSCSMAAGGRGFAPHVLYNLGRITTYIILGGLVGGMGSFLGGMEAIAGIQRWVMAAAGAFIIIFGIGMLGLLPVLRYIERMPFADRFIKAATKLFTDSASTGAAGAFYPMGIVLGFLPCGLVYTALITAGRNGLSAANPIEGLLSGALTMAAFGIGTAPSLILFGRFFDLLSARLRRNFYRLSAVIVIGMGAYFIIKGFFNY